MRIFFWGAGTYASSIWKKIVENPEFYSDDYIGFIDNNPKLWGDCFLGKKVIQGFLALNANSFNRIMNCSILMKVWIVVFCFSLPFSSFVKIEYKTYRHKAEQELYQVGTYVGNMSASSNHQRMDDAGLFIVSLLVSAVSGPFFLIYRLYKMVQIGRYIKR